VAFSLLELMLDAVHDGGEFGKLSFIFMGFLEGLLLVGN
jgi:hypothetical protein